MAVSRTAAVALLSTAVYAQAPVHGCFTCGSTPSGVCCAPGQFCPGQVACCGTGQYGSYACNTTCVPKCSSDWTCGTGGCPGGLCGKGCGDGEICSSPSGGTCKCDPLCQCGSASGTCGAGCPTESSGCAADKCTCQGPGTAPKILHASKYIAVNVVTNGYICENSPPHCGGYSLINSTDELAATYGGAKGGGFQSNLMAIFETPDKNPLPGKNIFINFGAGNNVQNCCPDNSTKLTFSVAVDSCEKVDYTYCDSKNESCFSKEACKGNSTTLATFDSLGNNRGFWVPNPGTAVFHVTMSVTDIYYTCTSCGNSNEAKFTRDGIQVQY